MQHGELVIKSRRRLKLEARQERRCSRYKIYAVDGCELAIQYWEFRHKRFLTVMEGLAWPLHFYRFIHRQFCCMLNSLLLVNCTLSRASPKARSAICSNFKVWADFCSNFFCSNFFYSNFKVWADFCSNFKVWADFCSNFGDGASRNSGAQCII